MSLFLDSLFDSFVLHNCSMSVPHSFNYCSFVITFEIRKYESSSFFFRIVWLDLCTYMKYYSPVRAYCLCTVLFVFRYVVSSQNTIFQSSKAMYFSSYSFCFPKYHMNKILLYIAFYGWFLSLSKISLFHSCC